MKTGIEFIETFKASGISHDTKDKRFQDTLDFQDFVGHMNFNELKDFYRELDQDQRRTFMWACTCTLHQDTCIDVIRATTISLERSKLYEEFELDIEKRETDLFKKGQTLQDCKRSIYRKIRKLNEEIETLKNRLAWQTTNTEHYQSLSRINGKKARRYETKACHFDNVRGALALILDTTID